MYILAVPAGFLFRSLTPRTVFLCVRISFIFFSFVALLCGRHIRRFSLGFLRPFVGHKLSAEYGEVEGEGGVDPRKHAHLMLLGVTSFCFFSRILIESLVTSHCNN